MNILKCLSPVVFVYCTLSPCIHSIHVCLLFISLFFFCLLSLDFSFFISFLKHLSVSHCFLYLSVSHYNNNKGFRLIMYDMYVHNSTSAIHSIIPALSLPKGLFKSLLLDHIPLRLQVSPHISSHTASYALHGTK